MTWLSLNHSYVYFRSTTSTSTTSTSTTTSTTTSSYTYSAGVVDKKPIKQTRTNFRGENKNKEVVLPETRIENMISSAHEWVSRFAEGYKKEKKLMRNINRIWEKMSFSLDGQDTNCRVKWNEATGLHPGSDGNWNGTAGWWWLTSFSPHDDFWPFATSFHWKQMWRHLD